MYTIYNTRKIFRLITLNFDVYVTVVNKITLNQKVIMFFAENKDNVVN